MSFVKLCGESLPLTVANASLVLTLQVVTPEVEGIPTSFEGCVHDLLLGSRSVDLLNDFEQAANIGDCFISVCDEVDCSGRGNCTYTVVFQQIRTLPHLF